VCFARIRRMPKSLHGSTGVMVRNTNANRDNDVLGLACAQEGRWGHLVNDDEKTQKPPCPDFDLASLHSLPRELFGLVGHNDLDGFVLSLALAYNDLKGIYWVHQQLEACRPADASEISPFVGQWNGMRIQTSRTVLAITHEVLRSIGKASEQKVLELPDFRAAVRLLEDGPAKKAWKRLVAAGLGKPREAELREYMRVVRNKSVFHYNQWQEILQAYQHFFVATETRNSSAFVSLGGSMEATRFYFADAVAQTMYVGTSDTRELFRRADELATLLHVALHGILRAFIVVRTERLRPHTP
jgi:hypothetical protein